MKEFENKIYRRLLAPVLACLVLVLAGCSQDATEAEAPSSPTGGTYLTIVTRGITTTDSDLYEDYVGSLRVMAFDNEGNRVINELVTDLPPEGDPDSDVTITEELPAGTITSGVYTFYFVANENDYNTTTESQTLSVALKEVTNESDLKAIQVKTELTQTNQIKPSATNMLMSTEPYTALIREGEVNKIGETNHIELIRAFAKAQLALKLADGNTSANPDVTRVTLNGSYPDYFYLIPGNTTQVTSTESFTNRTINEDENKTLFDESLNLSPVPFYVSEAIYLPERYLTNDNNIEDNALKYSITIGDNDYSAPIADGTEDPVNYNIIRNYAYTTIGIYDPAVGVTLETLTYTVRPWGKGGGEHTFN